MHRLRIVPIETDVLIIGGGLAGCMAAIRAAAREAFDAGPLAGYPVSDVVVRIKSIGEEKRGDVTYTVVIEPDEQDPRLRWNMTALVTIP